MISPYRFFFGRAARRSYELREAVAALFSPRGAEALETLGTFDEAEWRRNLLWLDASGMALYLLEDLQFPGSEDVLPPSVRLRLEENAKDNRTRTTWLLKEMKDINEAFDEAGIVFANLKGFTLYPDSVSHPAHRCQLDLDMLIEAGAAPRAAEILDRFGYVLHAIEGDTWEFKAGSSELPRIDDLYKPRSQRSVELHLTSSPLLLHRSERRSVLGVPVRSLSAADQFLNQAVHLFKHLRSEFTRTSWGLEFVRHLRAKQRDAVFWQQVRELAEHETDGALAIGAAIVVVEELFGEAAPVELRAWTVDVLPRPLVLWLRLYGRCALLSDYPGNKFYLFLEQALAGAKAVRRAGGGKRLLPLRLPAMITRGEDGESYAVRVGRYRTQVAFLFFRLKFHVVQGGRYLVELPRWSRLNHDVDL